MTRYERIKAMSIEQVAEAIIEYNITDDFCKYDCDTAKGGLCRSHPVDCCVRWLLEVAADD